MPRKIRKIALGDVEASGEGDWKTGRRPQVGAGDLAEKLLNPQWPELQGRPTTLLKL